MKALLEEVGVCVQEGVYFNFSREPRPWNSFIDLENTCKYPEIFP